MRINDKDAIPQKKKPKGAINECVGCYVLSQHVGALTYPLPVSLSYTHTYAKGKTWHPDSHNYSTNCCPSCCWPVCIMSQRSNDSFELLIMQFLWSALLAHARRNLCAAAADWGNCGNNCLSFLVGCFDVWRIPLWCTNRVV